MRITVGSDHAGCDPKMVWAEHSRVGGHQVGDPGAGTDGRAGYRELGTAVARAVTEASAEQSICHRGIGMAVGANEVVSSQAPVAHRVIRSRLARQHNHATVLCTGGRIVGEEVARDGVEAFLPGEPIGGCHDVRMAPIALLQSVPC